MNDQLEKFFEYIHDNPLVSNMDGISLFDDQIQYYILSVTTSDGGEMLFKMDTSYFDPDISDHIDAETRLIELYESGNFDTI